MPSNAYISSAADFSSTLEAFLPFHTEAGNNVAHLLTSSMGFLGFFSLISSVTKSEKPAAAIGGIYLYYLFHDPSIPMAMFVQTFVLIASVMILSAKLPSSIPVALTILAFGYGLQDFAHYCYGEETFQENTWGKSGTSLDAAASLFFQHVFYLLPLVCASLTPEMQNFVTYAVPVLMLAYGNYDIDSDSSGFPHTFVKVRALFGKMTAKGEGKDIDTVRKWAMDQKPPQKKTSHWWVSDLCKDANDAFHRLEKCDSVMRMFAEKFDPTVYSVDVVGGMNELYISGPNRSGTSDQVFFTEHIDGPYILFPFASIYRCIVGMDGNTEISTCFSNVYERKTAQKGDILAFDFNREPHYITSEGNKPNKDFRVVLKLHYAVYPKRLAFFGWALHWLTTRYNELFRALFLFTLTPSEGSFSGFVGEYAVNGGTVVYNSIDKLFGTRNILYVFGASLAGWTTGSYSVFLGLTQYVHYCRYITTYYKRKQANYGMFKRDVLFFKSVALLNLAYMVLKPLWVKGTSVEGLKANDILENIPGFAMIIVGYGVSVAATAALGVDGTYFGIELGYVEADYQFVKSFPYNCIPHPMILSQVCALAGMHTFEGVGGTRGWIVPVHVAFYLTHMTQEIYDYWDGTPWFEKKD